MQRGVLMRLVRHMLALACAASLAMLPAGCGGQAENQAAEAEPQGIVTDAADVPAVGEAEAEAGEPAPAEGDAEGEMSMRLLVDGSEVSVAWEDNESVDALRDLAASGGLTVSMSMYGGFEQVGSLGADLPVNDEQITTAAGDIVLYSGNQVVVFYGSNTWAYTRLGRIVDTSAPELAELLGNGDVTLTLFLG